MVCRLLGAKPLSDAMLAYCQLDPWELISVKFYQNTTIVIENSELEKVACKLSDLNKKYLNNYSLHVFIK